MSNYDEVKFVRRLLQETKRELDAATARCRSLELIIKAQQEQIREAHDARRVSQYYAAKHLKTAADQQATMKEAENKLNYSLEKTPHPHGRVCDYELWWANFHAWKVLHDWSTK